MFCSAQNGEMERLQRTRSWKVEQKERVCHKQTNPDRMKAMKNLMIKHTQYFSGRPTVTHLCQSGTEKVEQTNTEQMLGSTGGHTQ